MPKKSIEELHPNYSTVVDCLRQVIRNLDKTEFEPNTWEQDKSYVGRARHGVRDALRLLGFKEEDLER